MHNWMHTLMRSVGDGGLGGSEECRRCGSVNSVIPENTEGAFVRAWR